MEDQFYIFQNTHVPSVFFFPWKSTSRENFCSCFREKSKVSVIEIQKVHEKNPKCPLKFWKKLKWKPDFYTWKTKKLHSWIPKSEGEKSGKKSLTVLFFVKLFQLWQFFSVYNGFYIVDSKLCVKIIPSRKKTHFCWRENLQLIREI